MHRTTRLLSVALCGGLLFAGSSSAGAAEPDDRPHPLREGLSLLSTPGLAGGASPDHHRGSPRAPRTVVEELGSPLSFDFDRRGSMYVGQAFDGKLTKIGRYGMRTDLVSQPGSEVAAVSVRGKRVTFALNTETDAEGNPLERPTALLQRIDTKGHHVRTITDLARVERKKNPDRRNTYGFRRISDDCAAQWPVDMLGPVRYRGDVYSHPYATVTSHRGKTYVADAGANAIWRVDRHGHTRVLAVLPPVPVTITAEVVEQYKELGVPDCVIGLTYWSEGVPTDIEWGRHGYLYVTSLPGGPEVPGSGAAYRLSPWSGKLKKVAGGLTSATGLAVDRSGDIYVSELFTGQVSRIREGSHTAKPYASVPLPSAVEYRHGKVYIASDGLMGPGSIVKVRAR